MKILNSRKGFTLIELLVVIFIIGILASLSLSSYSSAQKQARDARRKSDLIQYRNALQNYASTNGGLYPDHDTTVFDATDFCDAGGDLLTFMGSCPADPLAASAYYYYYLSSSDRTRYIVYANLETTTKPYWYICSTGKTDKTADDTEVPDLTYCP